MGDSNQDPCRGRIQRRGGLASLLTGRLKRTADRLRLYGWRPACRQIIGGMFRGVFRSQRLDVFAVAGSMDHPVNDPCVRPLTVEAARSLREMPDVPRCRAEHAWQSLQIGCPGVCMEIDGTVAGYAMAQLQGDYPIGPGLSMSITPGLAALIDLFVRPRFRGQGLARRLNAALLNRIPADRTGVGFVRIDNRYSLRSWVAVGAARILRIDRTCWFNGRWTDRITVLRESDSIDLVVGSLRGLSGGAWPGRS